MTLCILQFFRHNADRYFAPCKVSERGNMEKKVFELDFRGRKIVVEHGEMAKQAHGAVLVRYGDTVVLSTAVAADEAKNTDFFPLTVTFEEKLYSVGKIPGGFLRREGKPSEHATLSARLINRHNCIYNLNFISESICKHRSNRSINKSST